MNGAPVTIAPPGPGDRDAWESLYRGYAEFYKVPMTDGILGTVWGWIHDPAHEVDALVARHGADLVGLAHFRAFSRPLRGTTGLFLDDLFVAPAARGDSVGDLLLAAVAGQARDRGFGLVRWITAEDNYRARGVYDRLASRTRWVTYDMEPGG